MLRQLITIMMITKLRYGNTNTYFIRSDKSGMLIDTDYAGTLPSFFKAIKENNIRISDIEYVIATHYHPDHCGLIGELMKHGVKLILADVQRESVHFSDRIFNRDDLPYEPIDETKAIVISCDESREFLDCIGIAGEIIHTPSHSDDSISLILDSGECFIGDTEPSEYIEGYESNPKLEKDWNCIMKFHPKKICFSHINERNI